LTISPDGRVAIDQERPTRRSTSSAASVVQPAVVAVRPAIFDGEVLAYDEPGLAQALAECGDEVGGILGRAAAHPPDHRQIRQSRRRSGSCASSSRVRSTHTILGRSLRGGGFRRQFRQRVADELRAVLLRGRELIVARERLRDIERLAVVSQFDCGEASALDSLAKISS
jgi:hypothetical protein